MRLYSLTGLAIAFAFLVGCGGPKECKALADCCKKMAKMDDLKGFDEDSCDGVDKMKDKDQCADTLEGFVTLIDAAGEDVPKECKVESGDKDKKKKKGDDDEDEDKDKKKKDKDEDKDEDKGDKDKDEDKGDKDKDEKSDKGKDEGGGGGGGGGCEAYGKCVEALGKAYEEADFPGAKDSAKAMRDSAKMMLEAKGAGADAGCTAGLDALRKSADAYKSMPKFKFPDECK
jgi:hypothetical protein